MRICPDCNMVVPATESIEIDGKYYHAACRRCYQCGQIIYSRDKEVFEGHNYHSACLHSAKTCCICGKVVFRYVRDYWGNTACVEHGNICRYCGHLFSGGKEFNYSYVIDGKREFRAIRICDKCASSIVQTQEAIERCRAEVMAVFEAQGISGIPDDIPITLSDMKEESGRLGMGLWGLNYGRVTPSRTRYSFVITIHNCLPYVAFKGVLAHELLHSWLMLYAIELPKNEKEGFCNLGEFLVLKQEGVKDAEYIIHYDLEENKDPVYGDGFRLMKMRLEKLGWKGLMDALLWENKEKEHFEL